MQLIDRFKIWLSRDCRFKKLINNYPSRYVKQLFGLYNIIEIKYFGYGYGNGPMNCNWDVVGGDWMYKFETKYMKFSFPATARECQPWQ